ncbi:MAG: sensor histidine kinase [Gemmatimonadaceae bacterium]
MTDSLPRRRTPARGTALDSELLEAELRLRTALELHDGILQTLTGATLQIAAARKLVRTDPGAAERILTDLGRSVSAEQQEMRLFVDEVKGDTPEWADERLDAHARIGALLDRVAAIWGVEATVDAQLDGCWPRETLRCVLRIVQEATVNAARHGAAHSVAVTVAPDGSDIDIRVADDGHGFPFHGAFDHETLRDKRLGPVSLKYRVETAGGRMSIESTPRGATVSVRIPVEEPRRA